MLKRYRVSAGGFPVFGRKPGEVLIHDFTPSQELAHFQAGTLRPAEPPAPPTARVRPHPVKPAEAPEKEEKKDV